MTTDPVQEARDEVIATAHDVHTDAQLREALDAYAAAIRREEAARVLPVLRAVEWGGEIDFCPGCSAAQWTDQHESWCLLAAEITRLEALTGYHRCTGCGRTDITEDELASNGYGGHVIPGSVPDLCGPVALVKEGEDD